MLFSFQCPACKGKLEADASLSGSQSPCPHCAAPVAIPESRVGAGTTLAGFRLERRLGQGGMGEVYLAQQLSVKRQVAVKILPPGFAANPEAVQRFMHEGRLAARLDHANIVTVFEAGEDSGHFYLAMAYIEGESLDHRLKRDTVIPEAEALGIIRAMADALAYAWDEFKLLHRDLKPANIMVDRRGRVFLMDLGLAKSLGDDSGLTLSGSVIGTPQYMSPEQAQGVAELGVPTDVYALGATLYHLVTGTPPFRADSALGLLNQHVHAPLPPPRERNPELTEACCRLIETMMAKQPSARYGDWRVLIAGLDRVLHGAASAAVPAVVPPAAGPSGFVVPPSGGPPLSRVAPGSAAAPAAPSRADSARSAPPAQPPGPRAPPVRAAPQRAVPVAKERSSRLSLGLTAAVVVVLVLVGVLVAARRGRTAPLVRPSPAAVVAVPAATTSLPPRAGSAQPAFGQPYTVPDLGLELLWVAPGSFQMGSNAGEPDEKPVHAARLSRGYWIGKYEVTQAEYEVFTGMNPSFLKGQQNPVEMVSWDEVTAFCTRLTERERSAGRLLAGYEYRLPTEAEWEYAARGGTGSKGYAYAGSNTLDEVAWCSENSGNTAHPVGLKKPNELGLYDLSGNVAEWCLDLFAEYASSPAVDSLGPAEGSGRVVRGGTWSPIVPNCRVTRRYVGVQSEPGRRSFDGFRVCLGPAIGDLSASAAPAGAPATPEPSMSAPAAVGAPPAPGQPYTVPDLGLELLWVAPGSFQMGSGVGGADGEKPAHAVRLSRGYWIGKYEVTQAEYEALTGKTPSQFKGARNPVEGVSWDDVVAFCAKLTERERQAGRLPAGSEYRLPTEAEWEYAARGGAKSQATSAGSVQGYTYSGSNSVDEVGWYYGNSGDKPLDDSEADNDRRNSSQSGNHCRTHPVGLKKPNELGLYDLSGNLWEWCQDRYEAGHNYYANSPGIDPVNLQAGAYRITRGGAWLSPITACRSAARNCNPPAQTYDHIGFRICLAPAIEGR